MQIYMSIKSKYIFQSISKEVFFFCPFYERSGGFMGILSGLFRSRDKPKNSTVGSSYRFFYGQSSAGKCVSERSAMQMTAVYACVRI